ncbi:MAG: DNA topoisomerase 4 subunit A [Clostridia bacterium]|nr:DNA topoisomerase 4 subunit A [Clostridia bacterium]
MEENNKSIITSPLEDVLHRSMIPYAEYVILDRALPRVEDGLKPVQRRILYSMYDLGITPDKGYKKSARVVGDCLAKYHPHGDTSVYDAMVRLAQPYNMRNTLVDGHGNFGSIDGDSAAAMRYTEVKLQPLALELVTDLDKDTVDWQLNFDDSTKEPETLPGRFPNLLVNGATGIAVGLATNIPTHNLAEVIDGAVAYLDNPKITVDEMMKIVKGPDFPTGGYIIAGSDLRQAYETGKGKIQIRAKVKMENAENGKKNIVITEIPFQVNKAQLLSKIETLKEANKDILSGIADIADESDRSGMRAVIKLRKDVNPKPILDFLFKNTQLQISYGINMVAIADGKPKLMGLLEIMKYYVDYQISVILRRTKFDLNKTRERAHVLEGLIIAVTNIDEVIKIIKTSPDTPTAKQNLRKRFDLSEKQAQAILDLKLARITKLEVKNLQEELANLKKLIEELQSIVDSKRKQKDVVKKEILAIKKKYKDDRRSTIVSSVEDISIGNVQDKYVEDFVIGVNGNDLIRKVKAVTYKKYANNKTPAKGELFKFKVETDSDHTLFAFTNKGNCHKIDLEFIPEGNGAQSGGVKFAQVVKGVETGEKPIAFFAIKGDEMPDGKLYFYTANGMVRLSPWSEFKVAKSSFQAIKLKDKDEVVAVEVERPNCDFFFVTKNGACVRCHDTFPEYGRVSSGVKGVDVSSDDKLVTAMQIEQDKDYVAVVATSFGTFKKVLLDTVGILPRAKKGVKIVDLGREGKERVLLAEAIVDGEDIYIAVEDEDGNMYHSSTSEIQLESRMGKGKILTGVGIIKSKWVYSFRLKGQK